MGWLVQTLSGPLVCEGGAVSNAEHLALGSGHSISRVIFNTKVITGEASSHKQGQQSLKLHTSIKPLPASTKTSTQHKLLSSTFR
eukprot:6075720-Amphidinium_carterae.1